MSEYQCGDTTGGQIPPSVKAARKRTSAKNRQRLHGAIETQRLAALVEASDDAMISETLDGVVTSWNGAASRMFGYEAEDMVGHPIERIVPLDRREEAREIVEKLLRGERIDGLVTLRAAKDCRRLAITLTASPYCDASGTLSGFATIARAQTPREGTNDAKREATERKRQVLHDDESANSARMEILSVMSHEIRTPLNTITGFVDLLQKSTGLTPQQRRYAELVQKANALVLTIVNDVLDFSKIEAGSLELHLSSFSLPNLVADMMALVLPDATVKHLLLKCTVHDGVPDWITGSPSRLRQVLLNLLNNALKFTEKGSIMVDVRPRIGADGAEHVYFSIADTGIGIPADQHHLLFKAFSQADSSISRNYGGTGLGLAICKRLVEMMGGEIGIDSEYGRGSTVWFTASMPPAVEQQCEPDIDTYVESPIEHAERSYRILVVDDVDTNLEIAEAYLRDYGYQVDCVSTGSEAIQSLGSVQYDLVLMDIHMPGMDGISATRRIRALPPPLRDVPIIAMTADVLPRQLRAFLEAGMNDHIGKPIDRAKFYNNVLRWLPMSKGQNALIRMNSQDFDKVKFDEFLVVAGVETVQRVVDKFLVHLDGSFKSTWESSQRDAHSLINTAGVLGLDAFVESCRRAIDFGTTLNVDRGLVAVDDLRRGQSAAQQVIEMQLLGRMRGERSRTAA